MRTIFKKNDKCDYTLFLRKVRLNGRWIRNLGKRRFPSASSSASTNASSRLSLQKERKLTMMLLAATVAFFVCWTPYAVHVLVGYENVKPQLKKVAYFQTLLYIPSSVR